MQERPPWRRIDWVMLGSVLLLCMGGLLAIKSACHTDKHPLDNVRKEMFGIGIGLGLIVALARADYEILVKRYARFLYPVNILALLIVLKLGHASHGASRWIPLGPVQIQPSEFAKVILICTLSLFLSDNLQTVRDPRTLFKSLVHIGIPMLMIAKQPDLGTALVLFAIWMGMVMMAGARLRHIALVLLLGAGVFTGMWHFNKFKDYQKSRLVVFLNPDADPRDTGYHLRQSEIAIGSGGLSGEGYLKGMQSNGRFIPEQHTDFIFTVIGEEGGFVAALALLSLYLVLLGRGAVVMAETRDPMGRLLCAGVLAMLTFHCVINLGMTMGVMPVVGVPLPFFSYGLSSLMVNMAGVGLMLSVAARRGEMMF